MLKVEEQPLNGLFIVANDSKFWEKPKKNWRIPANIFEGNVHYLKTYTEIRVGKGLKDSSPSPPPSQEKGLTNATEFIINAVGRGGIFQNLKNTFIPKP